MAFGSGKKPANQGGSGKAPVQGAKIQAEPSGVKKPGASKILFGYAPKGQAGSGKNAGKVQKF
jgi:hypothetical protein